MKRVVYFYFFLAFVQFGEAKELNFSGDQVTYDLKTDLVTLRGNAKILTSSNLLKANLVVLNQKAGWARANGKVSIVNPVKQARLEGEEILYYINEQRCEAYRKPTLINEKDHIKVTADYIVGFMSEDRAEAWTNVFIHKQATNEEIKAWAEQGYFFNDMTKLNLISNCRAEMENFYASGDKINLVHKNNKVDLIGNAVILSFNTSNRIKTNILNAQWVHYDYPVGNRIFTAYTNVKLIDGDDQSTIEGQFLRNKPDTHYTYVTGNPSFQNGDKSMTLFADLFERFDQSDLLYAKGNVKIIHDEQKAFSSMAFYSKLKKKTLLYGNPRVESGVGVIYAERVSLADDQHDFQMEGLIRGNYLR